MSFLYWCLIMLVLLLLLAVLGLLWETHVMLKKNRRPAGFVACVIDLWQAIRMLFKTKRY